MVAKHAFILGEGRGGCRHGRLPLDHPSCATPPQIGNVFHLRPRLGVEVGAVVTTFKSLLM